MPCRSTLSFTPLFRIIVSKDNEINKVSNIEKINIHLVFIVENALNAKETTGNITINDNIIIIIKKFLRCFCSLIQ